MFDYPVYNTEEEAQKAKEFQLLPDGVYDFRITESKPRHSTSGNPMVALVVTINHEGKDYNVFDYLVGTANMAWKIKHFCEATGLEAQYAAKAFNDALALNRMGKCMVSHSPKKPKNDGSGGVYKAKNTIEDYVPATMSANGFAPFSAPLSAVPAGVPFNDDVPF